MDVRLVRFVVELPVYVERVLKVCQGLVVLPKRQARPQPQSRPAYKAESSPNEEATIK